MCAWTAPRTWVPSELVTAALMNTHVRDNLTYLKAFLGLFDLADPNADRIPFWDDGAGAFAWLVPNTNLAVSGTNLNVNAKYTRQVGWYVAEDPLTTGVNKNAEITYRGPAGTIVRADAHVKKAPTDASLTFDINIGGTTIWSTQANRLVVLTTATSGTQTTFDDTSITDGEILTLDIDVVGSTEPGEYATVLIEVECALETP